MLMGTGGDTLSRDLLLIERILQVEVEFRYSDERR
jgi:hypothetical protein